MFDLGSPSSLLYGQNDYQIIEDRTKLAILTSSFSKRQTFKFVFLTV